jgi:hypothetical protein
MSLSFLPENITDSAQSFYNPLPPFQISAYRQCMQLREPVGLFFGKIRHQV